MKHAVICLLCKVQKNGLNSVAEKSIEKNTWAMECLRKRGYAFKFDCNNVHDEVRSRCTSLPKSRFK